MISYYGSSSEKTMGRKPLNGQPKAGRRFTGEEFGPDRRTFAGDAARQAAIADEAARVAAQLLTCACGGDIADDGADGGCCIDCGKWWPAL